MSHSHPISQEQVVEHLGNLSVMQLVELTKTLEDKWGVKAEPIPLPGIAPQPGPEPKTEEQTEFSVVLVSAGEKKIEVIKVVRAALGFGLKEGKDLVDAIAASGPKVLKEGLNKAAAEELKVQLEAAGAKVELK